MTARRIALVVPSLGGGGAERAMIRLAGGMADQGREVDLVCFTTSGPLRDSVPASVRLVDLERPGRSRWAIAALARYFRRDDPSVAISALNQTNVAALAARAVARARLPVAVTVRSAMSIARRNTAGLAWRTMPAWTRFMYPRADAIVAISRGVADDLARLARLRRDTIDTIYNPVIGPTLTMEAARPVDDPWLASGQPPVVLAVGRLTHQKGFDTLLVAFRLLRRRRPCRLVILGEGPERTALERLAAALGIPADVRLPGFAQNPYSWMARADAFVLSSRWEGFANALVEALAVGAQVVATDCPSGPSEILGPDHPGLVPVDDPPALADAIERSLDSQTPSSVDLSRFTVEFATTRYLQLADRLASDAGGSR